MPRKKKTDDTTVGPIFQVKDLTGGVNLRASSTNIQPNQARRLVGTAIGSPGELGVYPGHLAFSTSSLASRRAQGGKRIYLAESIFTLAVDNGNVYKPSDAGVWGSSVLSTLNTTNPVDFVYDRDIVSAFDSSTVPKKSKDAVTWTQLGITQPAVPGLALVAGGSLVVAHIYEVSYAYVDTSLNQTSNATNSAQSTPAGANLTIRVSYTASASADVDKIKIYVRDVTAGETVRRLSIQVNNATATTDITINNWDGQEEASSDHDPAVAMSFGIVWKNRWWGRDAIVGNRLRFSQIFQNQSWPTTFYVDIPFERGESITATIALGDIMVVFGFTKFYLIIGQTSLDFEVRPALGGQTGTFGFRAVDVIENGIVHAGSPGVYVYNGATDQLLSYPIDTAWSTMVGTSASSELALVPLCYHKKSKEMRVGMPYLYPTGGRGEWILDLNRTNIPVAQQNGSSVPSAPSGPAWFSTVRTVGGYIQWDGNEAIAGNQGRLFSWSPTIVKLFEERVGTTADGSNRTMEYDGYMLPFGLQNTRLVDTYIEYQPCSGTLTVNLKIDGRLVGAQSFDLGTNLSRYGIAQYGVSVYSGGPDRTSLPVMWPLNSEGRAAQLLLKYVGQGDFKVFTYGHNSFSESVPRGI